MPACLSSEMTEFTKPALTIDEQIQLLTDRNLIIKDKNRAARYLEVISFFRLSAYMRPFQIKIDINHGFRSETTFKQIVDLYAFDRELRLMVMDASERVEVAIRSTICNHMGPEYGAHWYIERALFRGDYNHSRLIRDLENRQGDEKRSLENDVQRILNSRNLDETVKQQRIESREKENYLRFYSSQYDSPALPPGWAMVEELSLGALSHLYRGIARDSDKKMIATRFNLPHHILGSWLHTLTFIRNCCAHHSRLWNRELSISPKLPNRGLWPDQNETIPTTPIRPARRIFIVIMMLDHLMKQVSPDSLWLKRFYGLLKKYPDTQLTMMGFPENWQDFLPE